MRAPINGIVGFATLFSAVLLVICLSTPHLNVILWAMGTFIMGLIATMFVAALRSEETKGPFVAIVHGAVDVPRAGFSGHELDVVEVQRVRGYFRTASGREEVYQVFLVVCADGGYDEVIIVSCHGRTLAGEVATAIAERLGLEVQIRMADEHTES